MRDLAVHDHPEAGHGVIAGLLGQVVALRRQQGMNRNLNMYRESVIAISQPSRRRFRPFLVKNCPGGRAGRNEIGGPI